MSRQTRSSRVRAPNPAAGWNRSRTSGAGIVRDMSQTKEFRHVRVYFVCIYIYIHTHIHMQYINLSIYQKLMPIKLFGIYWSMFIYPCHDIGLWKLQWGPRLRASGSRAAVSMWDHSSERYPQHYTIFSPRDPSTFLESVWGIIYYSLEG